MLNSLTSFRFIAALMVFIFHMGLLSKYQLGAAGVQFFFVLSGFILAYNYHSKFDKIELNKLKSFYKARFAKIYPVHILTFIIATPLVIKYFNPDGFYFIKFAYMSVINLSLIQSFIPNQGTYFNFNGVSWTLSVEAFFYLTFPFLILMLTKLKVGNRKSLSLISLLIVWIVLFYFNTTIDENNSFMKWAFHIFPFARLFEFVTGMTLGLIFVSSKREFSQKASNWLESLSVLLFILLLLLSVQFDVGIVRGVYFIPVWCLLIYSFAFQNGMFSRLLSNKVLVYLGEISFSFYMIHQLVIRYFYYINMDSTLKLIICFSLSIILSAIIYQYYEEPIRKKIRYGWRKPKEITVTDNVVQSKIS